MDRIEYGTDGNTYKFWISNGKEYADSDRAVSLNAAIEALKQCKAKGKGYEQNNHAVDNCIVELMKLPSVSQPKTGHWIEKDDNLYECSECGQYIYSETEHDLSEFHAFCGRCGAKMVEPQKGARRNEKE